MQKTKMCDFHKEGRCKYGSECAFAHSEHELKDLPDLRKTRICRAFTQGKCNATDCKFAHGADELRTTDLCYKTSLCAWYDKGICQSGDQCRFAHGNRDLQGKKTQDGAEAPRSPPGSPGGGAPAPKNRLKRRLRQRLRRSGRNRADGGQGGNNDARSRSRSPRRSGSDSDSEDQDGPTQERRGSDFSVACPRCESTIAAHLGYTACAVCRA